MNKQKPETYLPRLDSPFIGGHGYKRMDNMDVARTMFYPEGGAAFAVPTATLITLLEVAYVEFPSPIGGIYLKDEVEKWKKKWLTIPPDNHSSTSTITGDEKE